MTRKLEGRVTALWRYPVSSLAGQPVDHAEVDRSGFVADRAFGVFDASKHAIVFPSVDRSANVAPMAAARLNGHGCLELTADGDRWGGADDPAILHDLSALFGRDVLVARYGTTVGEAVAQPRYERAPIHLLSRQALEALAELLPRSVIDIGRFRPNILVDLPGTGSPMPESSLLGQEFRIGQLRLRGARPCGRCSFTTFAQRGIPEDRAVLRMLISRFGKDFGILCEVLDEGTVTLGDTLEAELALPPAAPIVIVGAGQAGAMTARALRELGEKGPIDIFGEERQLPYERPPLSKAEFRQDREAGKLPVVLTAREAQDGGIGLHLGTRVVAIDRERKIVELDDGGRQAYSRLVIATGGSARRVPRLSRGYGRVHSIRTMEDAGHLYRRLERSRSVFVLGGGWLGLEMAATARSLGLDVTLFARQQRLCARVLPLAVSDWLLHLHRARGVRFRLGAEPNFTEHEDRVGIDGETDAADMLIVAIGMSANDGLARRAGLPASDGVLTDMDGATEDPDIYAVGDVARQRSPAHPEGMRLESWHGANDQACRAARRILSLEREAPQPPRFWSHQYDAMLQIVGMPDPSAVPLAALDGPDPWWEFAGFAIGVNRPGDMHRFVSTLQGPAPASPVAAASRSGPQDEPQELVRLPLAKSDAIVEERITRIVVEPVGALAVTRRNGQVLAVSDRCPHADAPLSEGFLEAGKIVCPIHFAEFDLRTGQPSNAPPGCSAIACYTVEEADGELFVCVPR